MQIWATMRTGAGCGTENLNHAADLRKCRKQRRARAGKRQRRFHRALVAIAGGLGLALKLPTLLFNFPFSCTI